MLFCLIKHFIPSIPRSTTSEESSSFPTSALRSGLSLLYSTPHCLPHPPPCWRSSACMGAPQSPSALLSLDLALFFCLHSSNTFCVLLFSTQHSPSGPPLFQVVTPLFHPNDHCLSNAPFKFVASQHLITPGIDITN